MLWPQGIEPHPTELVLEPGLALAVVNPSAAISRHGASLCLGRILDTPGEWWRPRSASPDGVYALCRSSSDAVEIVTDIAASRAVWYYRDDDVFLASSSQRPLIALLGRFELDREAVTWMVASRSLGPRASYDRRLAKAPLDGIVRLDRRDWSVEVASRWAPYRAIERSDEEHARLLNEAIVETCAQLAPQVDQWPLLLSGGYDSRALLVGMRQAGLRPTCVTWGFRSALDDEGSDAAVAARLAAATGVAHEFFVLDAEHDAAVEALDEFVARSEGQCTDFTMYVDGFATWRALCGQGRLGVIRGDNYPWAYLGEFR
ncbi:MAG TPA: asparagine synthase-related protein, partial [Thermoleophilia bacterium]|nr:asparagine synthase-related protein [Thermoleophilia bacterium]